MSYSVYNVQIIQIILNNITIYNQIKWSLNIER